MSSAYVKILIAVTCISLCESQLLTDIARMFKNVPEDGILNFTQLARKYGRETEEFDVITPDGYVLKLFHIIPNERKLKAYPVILKHGIADCADNFIIRTNTSLAMSLAREGYDVWAVNTRGNKYTRRHLKWDPVRDKKKFWNYSFHENAYYDLASLIDEVLIKTGHKKINAIAHSQGTTEFLVLGSTRPEYNNKVNVVIAMAPVVYLNHVKPPVSTLIDAADEINRLSLAFGMEELLNKPSRELFQLLCSQPMLSYDICANGLLFAIGGKDPNELEKKFLPVIAGHYPQAASRKGLLHFAQIAKRRRFSYFDYDTEENLRRYNNTKSPDYDLSKCTMKIALFVSKNDGLSIVKDVLRLKRQLPNAVEYVMMEPNKWNHLDWVWAKHMSKHLYPHIYSILDKYNDL